MANQIQTSFIPKGPVRPTGSSGGGMGIFMLLSVVLLGASLILFAGVFGYKYLILDSINRPCEPGSDQGCGLRETLERDKRELQIQDIINRSRFDAKMKQAAGIINNHIDLLPLFNLLQEVTLQTVRYTKFDYADNTLSLEGTASSYDDIAVQLRVFNNEPRINTASFSDLTLNQQGSVTFKATLTFDPRVFNYRPAQSTVIPNINQSTSTSTQQSTQEEIDPEDQAILDFINANNIPLNN